MDEPPILKTPETRGRLSLLFVGLGIAAVFGLLLIATGVVWWRTHRASLDGASPGGPASRRVNLGFEERLAAETAMFNGRDLAGWGFDPTIWSVRNGVIQGRQTRGGYGSSLFWRDTDIFDFELRFRFRLVRGNSGIYYRATQLANFDVGGYEFEIYTNKTGNLADNGTDREKRRLHRAESTAPDLDAEWHEGVIRAIGPQLIHELDGVVLCKVEDRDPAAPKMGAIAFAMGSGTVVEFKDLQLKRQR